MNRWCYALLLGTLANGCGTSEWHLSSVQGTVTQQGRPLAGIRVTFLPDAETDTKGPRSLAITDAEGRYELRTDGGELGAVRGRHRVCLLDMTFADAQQREASKKKIEAMKASFPSVVEIHPDLESKRSPAASWSRISPNYGQAKETPLRADVHSNSQTVDFNVPVP